MKEEFRFIRRLCEGDFKITQAFGEHPEVYGRFGLRGHNGIDIDMPIGTKILAGCRCTIIKDVITDEPDSYGNHIVARAVVGDRIFLLLWAHLDSLQISGLEADPMSVIGLSGKSGCFAHNGKMLSDEEKDSGVGSHLHFGIKEIDTAGHTLNKDNGYNGYLDPILFFEEVPMVKENEPAAMQEPNKKKAKEPKAESEG